MGHVAAVHVNNAGRSSQIADQHAAVADGQGAIVVERQDAVAARVLDP